MRILYLHQYFLIPSQAGGTRSYWNSLEFIKNGHSVTMIASRAEQQKLIEIETIDGIRTHYIRNYYSNLLSPSRRAYSFIRFMLISTIVALRQTNIDLVYASSTPLTIGFPALIVRIFKRTPFIFEVRDLWPEFPIQIGLIRRKLTIRIFRSFEKRIYTKASKLIALSPGMKKGIESVGIKSEKITVVPNMSKIDQFFPRRPNREVMREFNITPDKYKVIHFGTMGLANGLDYVIEAARILKRKGISNIEFVLLGDGMVKKKLIKEVFEAGLEEMFVFIDRQPMDSTSEIVNSCDCSIISFKNLPVLQTNSPNKLFDSLSAGKPVIVNSAGWTKTLVEENEIGFYCDPEKPIELVEKICFLKDNKELTKRMGSKARELATKRFDKSILCKKLVEVLER